MSETDELKETLELTDFLTAEQIEQIVSQAIRTTPSGYEARLEIGLLVDALKARGVDVENRFESAGNEVIPKGTYEFLYENDLGEPLGSCQNYGCGHPIRFEEHIRHIESGREFVVGNVCVERILGEHDLVQIAISLLARMSGKLDRMSKADKCMKICGTALRLVVEADPNHWFTGDEYEFWKAIQGCKSSLTLKKAEEFKAKWTPVAFSHLAEQVTQRKLLANPDANTEGWMNFLTYKKQTRPNSTGFWDNCIEAVQRNGVPTVGQQSALHAEFKRFWAMARGDETVLEPLQGVFKYFGLKMLKHSAKCGSYFHIGLLEQLLEGRDLSWKQVEVLAHGCHMCGWKLD